MNFFKEILHKCIAISFWNIRSLFHNENTILKIDSTYCDFLLIQILYLIYGDEVSIPTGYHVRALTYPGRQYIKIKIREKNP